eukprot:TRINITY_DN12888_c0_g1_i7.p1 TRINITY_DN12888_c0_g1~~TRINITY_DN12888_c0_g1_i7.p1  ORF type:complete len:396 (-),score=32.87 TRINITY_DN12888_c0_g1_i7:457-1644(-)
MGEILVVPTTKTQIPTNEEESDDAWASPILKAPSGGVAVPMTTANKRTNLRRGKRDLMTSWLANPIPNGGEASSSSQGLPPLRVVPTAPDINNSDVLSDCFDMPTGGSLPRAGSLGAIPRGFSFSSCHTEVASSACSRASGSRPRETFNSIRARRLLEISCECDDNSIPPQPSLDVSHDNLNVSSCLSAVSSVCAVQPFPRSASPPCPEKGGVTFNTDAYNLDAWDADVMGLFALPTEGAPVFASRKDTPTAKLGDMSASIDPRRNDSLLSQEASKRDASSLQRTDISASVDAKQLSWSCSRPVVDDCLRSSVSVLSAYFDESRLKPAGTMTQDANPLSDHQDVCTVTSSALSLWNLFSPTEGDMPSFSVSPPLTQYHTSQLLPLTTPATGGGKR